MLTHPEYGTELTRRERASLFGPGGADDYRGVVQREGKVAWILVRTGAGEAYPNEVTRESIRYCYSTKDGKANSAMRRAFQTQQDFLVKVAPDGGPSTFFWGRGQVEVLQEDHVHRGRSYRRFVIVRSAAATQAAATQAAATQAAATQAAATQAAATQADVADLSCPETLEGSEGSITSLSEISLCRSKRSNEDSSEDDAKRARMDPELAALRHVLRSHTFDSLLERRHAAMMTLLRMTWTRDCVTFHNVGSGSYTPDFTVDTFHGGITQTYLVAIKPCYPYDDELSTCEAARRRLQTTPVALLYTSVFACPFADRAPRGEQGEYAHHSGVRGLKFTWDSRMERVHVEHDVAYAMGSDGIGCLDVRAGPEDAARFCHSSLTSAYSVAARA